MKSRHTKKTGSPFPPSFSPPKTPKCQAHPGAGFGAKGSAAGASAGLLSESRGRVPGGGPGPEAYDPLRPGRDGVEGGEKGLGGEGKEGTGWFHV